MLHCLRAFRKRFGGKSIERKRPPLRPVLAASYVAVLLSIGVTAGWAQARQETARVHDELGQRYVRALDPYQAPRQ